MSHTIPEKFSHRVTALAKAATHTQEGLLSAPQPAAILTVEGLAEAWIRAAAPGKRLLWLGPDKWLVVSETQPPGELMAKLVPTLSTAALTDVSHGLFRLRLRGAQVREILAAGISLDLYPSAFPVGRSTPCAWRTLSIVLHAVATASFDIYTPRSYASSLWEELAATAALVKEIL